MIIGEKIIVNLLNNNEDIASQMPQNEPIPLTDHKHMVTYAGCQCVTVMKTQ